jgi:glutamate racemase
MKIGVFDSGIGGVSVVRAIEKALPEAEIIFMNDKKNVPYGTKSPELLLTLVEPILHKLADDGCDVIVVACNTVSTTLIEQLRGVIKIPLVAMEPMVKPAAEMTKSGVIAVCATKNTLSSKRYAWLKKTYADGVKVLEPDCTNWATMIESNFIDIETVNKQIDDVCLEGADVIVLGCTHFHWIEDIVREAAAGRATVLQPEQPVITQLKKVIEQLS